MLATANHQPQGHPTAFSAEAVLLQTVAVAVLGRPAYHCKRCWNQCGRCSLGILYWHHLKAVCSAQRPFQKSLLSLASSLRHSPRILLLQQFAKLSSPSQKAAPRNLLVPVQLSLFSLLLNGYMFASIQWLFPLEINHRIRSPHPKHNISSILEAKAEKGFSDIQNNN